MDPSAGGDNPVHRNAPLVAPVPEFEEGPAMELENENGPAGDAAANQEEEAEPEEEPQEHAEDAEMDFGNGPEGDHRPPSPPPPANQVLAVEPDIEVEPEGEEQAEEVPERQDNVEMIQVDFEGRNPIDSDFEGVKLLLQNQLLRGLQVNPTFLTNLVLSQNYVGTVLKQTDDAPEDEDDDDDDMGGTVFGITSVVNLHDREGEEFRCIRQIRQVLKDLCNAHSDAMLDVLNNLLANDLTSPVGFLIHERFINLSAGAAPRLLQSLKSEITRANQRGMAFNFDTYIMVAKIIHEPGVGKIYLNTEEEILAQRASHSFEFAVEGEEADDHLAARRELLFISAETFNSFVDQL